MSPYITGLILGLFLGTGVGVFVLALLTHSRTQDDERDAARFRALQAHASAVSGDEADGQVSLTELADTIRSGRVHAELA